MQLHSPLCQTAEMAEFQQNFKEEEKYPKFGGKGAGAWLREEEWSVESTDLTRAWFAYLENHNGEIIAQIC